MNARFKDQRNRLSKTIILHKFVNLI